jgi:hypothetical protein
LYSGVRQFVAFFPLTHFFQKIIKYKITGLWLGAWMWMDDGGRAGANCPSRNNNELAKKWWFSSESRRQLMDNPNQKRLKHREVSHFGFPASIHPNFLVLHCHILTKWSSSVKNAWLVWLIWCDSPSDGMGTMFIFAGKVMYLKISCQMELEGNKLPDGNWRMFIISIYAKLALPCNNS